MTYNEYVKTPAIKAALKIVFQVAEETAATVTPSQDEYDYMKSTLIGATTVLGAATLKTAIDQLHGANK